LVHIKGEGFSISYLFLILILNVTLVATVPRKRG
jgi:hypothetical protein